MPCGPHSNSPYGLIFPLVSSSILKRKLTTIEATGAPTVVADNSGCLMQGGLHATGSPARTKHIAELIADRIRRIG